MRRLLLAAFALLLGGISQPRAAVLFHGGEWTDFTCTGSCTTSTSAGTFRTNYARYALQLAVASASDPPSSRFQTPVFTASSTLWVHFWYNNSNGTTQAAYHLVGIYNTAGNIPIVVRGTGVGSQFKISSRTAAGAYTDLVTCPLTSAIFENHQYDLKIVYGTSGEVTLYQDSVQQCTYSGNVTNGDGATQLNQAYFNGSSNVGNFWSEIIIADEDTRAMSRLSLYPVASGNTTGWTNSTGTTPCTTSILGKVTPSDTNYVYTGSSALKELCTVFNTWPAGTWAVKSVSVSIRALRGAGGPQNITPTMRVGTTDYSLTPNWTPTTTFNNGLYLKQDTSPATGSAWTQSELSAAGFNIGFTSAP